MKNTLHSLRTLAVLSAFVIMAHVADAQSIWIGTNGVTASTNWSAAGNWSTANVPGSGDAVVFTDNGNVATVGTVNNVVDGGSFGGTITSLQYANTNGTHTTLVLPGQTLTILGAIVQGTETPIDFNKTNTITGAGGAVVVNNTTTNLVVRQGGGGTSSGSRTVLDMSGLDTFTATVPRVFIGVGNNGGQNRATGRLILAKTNTITASSSSTPAVDIGESGSNNGGGSSLWLGQTNAIYANTFAVNRAKESGSGMSFNAAFPNARAYFRAADGVSRMTSFTINDGGSGSGTFGGSCTVDLSGGTVDILVDSMPVAKANSNTGSTVAKTQTATLTLKGGTLDVNTLQLGINTAANANWGQGTMTVSGSTLVLVNTALELGRAVTGSGADNTKGVLNLRDSSVLAAALNANFGSTNNTITMTNATLAITNNATAGINTFAITNSTLQLGTISLTIPSLTVTNLTGGGTTNKINIGSIAAVTGYPAQFPLIKYKTRAGVTNFGLGTLPFNVQPYVGYLSNTLTGTIDLVLTAGPAPARSIVWNGLPNGDWDVANNTNWETNGIATIFNQTDFVQLDDTANGTTTVNLTTAFFPSSLLVSNVTKSYTFNGVGRISGTTGLVKQGANTLILDNSGVNDFNGGVTIGGGTLQLGNADSAGNLPAGTITDNGMLAFDWATDNTVSNVIAGTGGVIQKGPAVLALAGANTFTGEVSVVQGTLRPINNAALGTTNGGTTIASGATLDLTTATANGLNLGTESITVSGPGVGGGGAIINSGANGPVAQQNAIRVVTLAGDTTFGGAYRWDVRGTGATLSTGGNAYNITKVGANQVSLVAVNPIDANLGNIDIKEGTFAIQTSTAQVGDSNKTITVWSYATLNVYDLHASPLNKLIEMQDAATIFAESGRSIVTGPVTLEGGETINVGNISATPTLTFSNTISGPGSLTKIGQGTLLLNGACSYLGGTINSGLKGTLIVNGTLSGGALSSQQGSLAGNGTIIPLADVYGGLLPGNVGGAGTLTAAGGLILEPGAVMTNDLSSTTTIGAGSNDLLEVTGDLTVNGNAIWVNLLGTSLQSGGTYRLIDYTGNLIGGFSSTVQQTMPTRYTFTLDQATANQVNLTVGGNPANLTWAATTSGSDAWDIAGTQNWDASTARFYQLDSVLFDDAAGVSNTVTLAAGIAVQPTAITNNSSAAGNNFTISGAGKITGAVSIVKQGTSTLTLSTTNDFTGPVTVEAGTLKFGTTNCLGTSAGATTVASGATLDLGSLILGINAVNLNQEQIFVSGSGVGGNGAIINSSTNDQENATHFVTLLGDTTFGGPGNWAATNRPGRWDIRGISNTDIATNTSAFLSTSNQPYNLTKVGSNWVAIVGVVVDPNLADINVQGGLLSIEHASTMGDPAKTLTVSAGATLEFYANGTNNLLNKKLVLYGDGVNTNVINGQGTNIFIGPVTMHDNCLFHIAATSLLLSGVIAGDANCVLNKYGPNTLYLSGANTYTGPTLVNAGILGLTNSGTIDSSVTLYVAPGATLDARGRADNTLTLVNGQTLQGGGTIGGTLVAGAGSFLAPGGSGPLTVSSNVTLLGTTSLQLDASTPTNDVIRCTATNGVITYGGTLDLVNVAIPLTTAKSFKLFSATNYAGSFAAITPPTPGAGLAWNTNTLAIDGTLRITNSVNPTPIVMTAVVTGSLLQLSWPTDHLGWDVQTNSMDVANSNLWFSLPGSATVTQVNITLDPLKTNVFFRMHYLKP